jgi:Uma2 family endonuclease
MTTVLGVPKISQTLLEDLDRVGRKYPRWTEQAYFELDGAYLVEYCRGRLEILPMPTMTHQVVAQRLFTALNQAAGNEGFVLFAGTRLEVAPGVFREPDVLYIPRDWMPTSQDQYTERAAIVIEVLSESNREHDLQTKRAEYARAGVPEYWIVDPQDSRITVLTLVDGEYAIHGAFGPGDFATSMFLPSFRFEVDTIFSPPVA